MTETFGQLYQVSGLIGVAFYLGAYAALQLGYVRGSSVTYTFLNLTAAGFVLISLFGEFNLASALIQISWILISLVGLARLFLLSRRLRFSAEEDAFLGKHLPDLPRASARGFLDAGTWLDVPQGYVMLTENTPVGNLFYLADGAAEVTSEGQHLAEVAEGFLGEINVVTGSPASATVTAVQPSRLFVISRKALNRMRDADSDFSTALEGSLNRDTGRKLMSINQRLTNSVGSMSS